MGTKEKLIERFKRQPTDFTFDEMIKLLGFFGYNIYNKSLYGPLFSHFSILLYFKFWKLSVSFDSFPAFFAVLLMSF